MGFNKLSVAILVKTKGCLQKNERFSWVNGWTELNWVNFQEWFDKWSHHLEEVCSLLHVTEWKKK